MDEYIDSLYVSEAKRLLKKLAASDFNIYQKIINYQIGFNREKQKNLSRLKKQNP